VRAADAEGGRIATMMQIEVKDYPSLFGLALTAEWPDPIGEVESPGWLIALLQLNSPHAPFASDDHVRAEIRSMMRTRGYKPSGRGKPASEYLLRAADQGKLGSINAAVDVCNVVSLHSGIPISVVDLDRLEQPLYIAAPQDDAAYVFNATGQEITVTGIPCLFDASGPCANGVKDSQRTKTGDDTRRTLSILWSTHSLRDHTHRARTWYAEILERLGARVMDAAIINDAA